MDAKEQLHQPQTRSRGRKRAPVRPGTRPAKATKTHSGGHPAFVPTRTERVFVQAMAGLRMSADEICKVIGDGRNGNGAPIAKSTLFRHFKNELANGRAMLKARVAGKFYAALDDDQPWAIQMAMRNQFNWDAGRNGFVVANVADDDDGNIDRTMKIVFVRADPVADDADDQQRSRLLPAPPLPSQAPVLDLTANKPTSVPPAGTRKGPFSWMD